jgi:alkaline phosphatase D
MSYKISRRQALAGLSATAALPLLGCTSAQERAEQAASLFAHGVASGDPTDSSVVLWTRVSGVDGPVQGKWQVAADSEFKELLASGTFSTDSSRDMTVKVVPDQLPPGASLYYRFMVGKLVSPAGRTRTLPTGHVEKLGIAVVSCSNYPFGYFNAYETIALDPAVDLVLHLGDYIYEYGANGYGGETGRKLGRNHQPPYGITSLDDYRTRHAQYKADPQSRFMHAAHPLVAIWDDHESANNAWKAGAQNHQSESEGDWSERRRASLQAYYEWMPVREPESGKSPEDYWRHFSFGDLASLITLESRHSGRVEQIEYGPYVSQMKTPEDARRFIQKVVAAPGREMLSTRGKAHVADALRDSVEAGQPWRIIGNQVLMARTHAPLISDELMAALNLDPASALYKDAMRFRRQGELGLPLHMDAWDGYPWAREQFYRMSRAQGAEDLLVLTGDSHAFWQNELRDERGSSMGVEIGTSGISSPGAFADLDPKGAAAIDQLLAEHNREVLWTEGSTNGYVRLTLTPQQANVDYVGINTVAERNYLPVSLRQVQVRRDGNHLGYL